MLLELIKEKISKLICKKRRTRDVRRNFTKKFRYISHVGFAEGTTRNSKVLAFVIYKSFETNINLLLRHLFNE